ncbi:C40 family peptidase [Streptomyces sp. NPDC086787]|uniref:C40 family peptidase n=1 Tax=Streptomyces sp. NPDC086787 TaxID=3365759 RepID=UPI003809DACF
MASHRKSRAVGTHATGPATTAPAPVAVLSRTPGAAPSDDGAGPSAAEIERKIDDLYRRRTAPVAEKHDPVRERSGRPRARDAAPETAAVMLADFPQDHFGPARLMGRLNARQAVRKRQEVVPGPEAPAEPAPPRHELPDQEDLKDAKTAVQLKLSAARVLLSERLTALRSVPTDGPVALPADVTAAILGDVTAAIGVDGSIPSAASFATRAEQAVAFARAQIGKPYVWGAAGPGSYDGPGLTQAAWKTAGVELPRDSRLQAVWGAPLSLADARPGDLVFFYDDCTHVGVYIGNGTMIHAPKPGACVREESVRYDGETIIHRVVRPA